MVMGDFMMVGIGDVVVGMGDVDILYYYMVVRMGGDEILMVGIMADAAAEV